MSSPSCSPGSGWIPAESLAHPSSLSSLHPACRRSSLPLPLFPASPRDFPSPLRKNPKRNRGFAPLSPHSGTLKPLLLLFRNSQGLFSDSPSRSEVNQNPKFRIAAVHFRSGIRTRWALSPFTTVSSRLPWARPDLFPAFRKDSSRPGSPGLSTSIPFRAFPPNRWTTPGP